MDAFLLPSKAYVKFITFYVVCSLIKEKRKKKYLGSLFSTCPGYNNNNTHKKKKVTQASQ